MDANKESSVFLDRAYAGIKEISLLSAEEEQKLAEIIHSDGSSPAAREEAIRTLVHHNLRYVFHFFSRRPVFKRDIDNLFVYGMEGLRRAAELYEPRGLRFSTYAHKWISSMVSHGSFEMVSEMLPASELRRLKYTEDETERIVGLQKNVAVREHVRTIQEDEDSEFQIESEERLVDEQVAGRGDAETLLGEIEVEISRRFGSHIWDWILQYYMGGTSFAEMGAEQNVSGETIRRQIRPAVEWVRKQFAGRIPFL